MSDFFYRQAKVQLPTGGSRIRNNAYVAIFSDGDESIQLLPSPATSMTATYNPNGSGRPAPLLKDVVVKLEGDAGSLRRVEANFTCYDKESFDELEATLLVPGSKILVKYGYVGPEAPSESAEHEFRVYDYSFKITTANYFECSFKGVGKGGTYEQNNINTAAAFPAKKFVTNYDFVNDTTTIQNIFDYMDYRIQRDGNKGTVRSMGNSAFAPKDGISGEFTDGSGKFAILEAPEKYNSPVKLEGGILTDYYLQYVQFKCIINWLNKYVLYDNISDDSIPKYKLKFDPKYSGIMCDMPSGKVWSADPGKMLFPYEKNRPENNYTAMSERPDDLDDFKFISCDKIDRSGYQHLQSDSGLVPGMGNPEYILICRDLMRTIQAEFNAAATKEKNKEEESDKSTGGMILNKFMKAIFANIRDVSGGAWDFYLDQDDLDPEVIWIINRRCPGAPEEVTALTLDPIGGSNGIRSLDIAASVPQETQAKIFGGSPDTVSEQEIGMNVIQQKDVRVPDQGGAAERVVKEQQNNARKGLNDGMYGTSAISAAKAALSVLVGEMDALERAKKGQFNDGNDPAQLPFPLSFSVTLDGIEGFRFGDTITTSYLPARYTKATSGLKIVFTVTKYEHKIANNDWTTTVTALGRIREA